MLRRRSTSRPKVRIFKCVWETSALLFERRMLTCVGVNGYDIGGFPEKRFTGWIHFYYFPTLIYKTNRRKRWNNSLKCRSLNISTRGSTTSPHVLPRAPGGTCTGQGSTTLHNSSGGKNLPREEHRTDSSRRLAQALRPRSWVQVPLTPGSAGALHDRRACPPVAWVTSAPEPQGPSSKGRLLRDLMGGRRADLGCVKASEGRGRRGGAPSPPPGPGLWRGMSWSAGKPRLLAGLNTASAHSTRVLRGTSASEIPAGGGRWAAVDGNKESSQTHNAPLEKIAPSPSPARLLSGLGSAGGNGTGA